MKIKKNLKSFLALFITVLTIAGNVLAEEAPTTQAAPSDREQFLNYFEDNLSYLSNCSDNDLEYAINNSVGMGNLIYSSFREVRGQYGELVKVLPDTLNISEISDGYEVSIEYECKKGKAVAVLILKKDISVTNNVITLYERGVRCGLESLSFKTANGSDGADLGNAALNTVLGLFTVFVVLVFISLIISQFKHINGISEFFKTRRTRKETVVHAIDNTLAQIEAKEAVESNDMELIAVITAAIAAGTHKSADGFMVKSIKRVR